MRLSLIILLFFITNNVFAGLGHKPPGPPQSGFGSDEYNVTDSWQTLRQGSAGAGDLTWTYIPDNFADGRSLAPVVIYLHGFSALSPSFYQSHIEHLVRQGNIVIFPLFQKSTFWGFLLESGLFRPMDQSIWAGRAVASVDKALSVIDDAVDYGAVYLYGHSLGGLIALAWQAENGVPLQAMILSHAQVDPSAGMPDFVRSWVRIIAIPWQNYASTIDVPVVVLNGDDDTIATLDQSQAIYDTLMVSPTVRYYIAQSDTYGYPDLSANHGAPMNAIAGLPPHLKIFDISGELDALDWRFYFTALDSIIRGEFDISFDMGVWSDATPVLPILPKHDNFD